MYTVCMSICESLHTAQASTRSLMYCPQNQRQFHVGTQLALVGPAGVQVSTRSLMNCPQDEGQFHVGTDVLLGVVGEDFSRSYFG